MEEKGVQKGKDLESIEPYQEQPNIQLTYKCFVCRAAGQSTKGKNVKTWKCDLLDPNFNFL